MTLNQCKNNWNYMYEWKNEYNYERGIEPYWFPCHIITDYVQTDNEHICIYTRNGTILKMQPKTVRKMTEKDYIKYREQHISFLGQHYKEYGFHETLEEDLNLLMKGENR